jgi:hypothetical protein
MIACRSVKALGPILALGAVALAGCTVEPPTGPDVAVMPGPKKTLPQFQQDDLRCRQYAGQITGGVAPAQAANQAGLGSAAIGTALGAAAGALLGAGSGNAGTGAAIGAGVGLLGGAAVGSGNAQASADNLQQRYDVAYTQCMATQGNQVPPPAPPPVAYAPPAYVVYPPPPPVVYYRTPGYWQRW